MCLGCYEQYGSPRVINIQVALAAKLIADVYKHEPCGGYAHIVVDDWNLEDEHIQSCLDDILVTTGARYFSPEEGVAWRCLSHLKQLSLEERATALAIHDGMIEETEHAKAVRFFESGLETPSTTEFPVGTLVRFRGEAEVFRVAAAVGPARLCIGPPSKRRGAVPYVVFKTAQHWEPPKRTRRAYLRGGNEEAVAKECERVLRSLTKGEDYALNKRLSRKGGSVPLFVVQEGCLSDKGNQPGANGSTQATANPAGPRSNTDHPGDGAQGDRFLKAGQEPNAPPA